MKHPLQHIKIKNFTTQKGVLISDVNLSYQLFGKKLGTAPIVLVNHALTGNSNVCGENGWWKDVIGFEKGIDTNKFTILAFNIPGNVYDGFVIDDYKNFIAKDIANIFLIGLKKLKIEHLFAIIGGSLGGGIGWEMAFLSPEITQHLIPIASDWKSTDWIIGNCRIQEQFLHNSSKPIHDARMHAMLLYRTPQSLNQRFDGSINEKLDVFNVESWLLHHGKKLQKRFQLSAYKLMNQLLKTVDTTNEITSLNKIKSDIYIISVDSDLFFTLDENQHTFNELSKIKKNVFYEEIQSIHGHDAFLIEYEQLEKIIQPIFNIEN
ncbi:MAG: alpha/beta fold hydrolase [Polaribacter sp.]